MKTGVKLFRGRNRASWTQLLVEAGWQPEVASVLAGWVTDEGPLPHWPPDHEIVRRKNHRLPWTTYCGVALAVITLSAAIVGWAMAG